MISGFLLIDKPAGWTSHDVVAKLRGITRVKKIGHGGTLDPLATGLLVVGVGQATKQLNQFVQGDKTYHATVRLGASSTTDDAEGELTPQTVTKRPDEFEVKLAVESFRGKQRQLTPAYSALKTGGKKHYELARAGKTVERKTRDVEIKEIELLNFEWPEVEFRCTVSKGTYIRSIARDLGEKLDTGGYLAGLRREKVGGLSLKKAISIDKIDRNWRSFLIQ